MIQELLRGGGGGAGVLGGATERKFSINCGVFEGSVSSSTTNTTHLNSSSAIPQPPPPPLSTTAAATGTTTTTATSNNNPNFPSSATVASDQQNLRCPRCDSSNTKFCYYNNYNLTQPRHFCKTCRRYWTKGGALRNVPIGGGCRKNKSSIVSTTAAAVKSSAGKQVKAGSPDIIKSALGFGFDHDHPPSSATNPILWPSPQNSHLLALLRATTQNQNPNPNPNPNPLKEEGNMIGSHHHMISSSDHHSTAVSGALNARSLSLDPMSTTSHVPMSLCSSFWRNNQNQNHHQQQQQQQQHQQQHHHHQQQQNHQQQQQSFLVGHEVQNSGIQELYQRLRSSTNYYSDHHSPMVPANNVVSTSATSTSILEPSSVAGAAELGYWNPSFSWSNLSTTNGAFP